MSRYAKEALTQQADFGLSHRISPREIFMLLGGFATSSHCSNSAVEVEVSMGVECATWVIVFFSHKVCDYIHFSTSSVFFVSATTRVTDAQMEINWSCQNSPKPLAIYSFKCSALSDSSSQLLTARQQNWGSMSHSSSGAPGRIFQPVLRNCGL